ncbi:hypothetical protein M3Y94_01312600 [Aphelenchoides besseyi]|nr:hypothetical protein M3Y94_01312600 [Aphelenchoides besseyi]KAI6220286.1 hypothetical protein M3Y95_01069000 [Aphelenchoides besseyi]
MPSVNITSTVRYEHHAALFMHALAGSNTFYIGEHDDSYRIFSARNENQKRFSTFHDGNFYWVEFGPMDELFEVNNQLLFVSGLQTLRLSFSELNEKNSFVHMIATIGYVDDQPNYDLPSV